MANKAFDSLGTRPGKKHWIAGAIKHPGREKRAAKRAGMSTHAYMQKHKGDKGSGGAAARLGLGLSAMSHRKAA